MKTPVKYLHQTFPDATFARKPVKQRTHPREPVQCRPGQNADGYGRRISTDYTARIGSRTYRVYVCQWSNAGTAYVEIGGEWHVVRDIPEGI